MGRVYDHFGIPVTEPRKGERYVEHLKMWSSGYEDNDFKIQWMRFHPECTLPILIQTTPHVAFRVDNDDPA